MMKSTEYDVSKSILETLRVTNKKGVLKEEHSGEKDSEMDIIAITNDAKFGQNVLNNQIEAFKSAVNNGAKFSKEKDGKNEDNPLVYYPNTGNLVFSGTIPNLSNLKFQFSLLDVTSSPYIFVEGLALTEETVNTLNKLRGYYLNWRDEWLASSDLLEKLKEGN